LSSSACPTAPDSSVGANRSPQNGRCEIPINDVHIVSPTCSRLWHSSNSPSVASLSITWHHAQSVTRPYDGAH
jgi:hypothetical protein